MTFTAMVQTPNELLAAAQAVMGVVTAMFTMTQGIVLIQSPAFTLFDVMVGGAFCTITIDFINRIRAPRVTNA